MIYSIASCADTYFGSTDLSWPNRAGRACKCNILGELIVREQKSPQSQWLERVSTSLKWRLIGPNFRNRFDSAVSDDKLSDYLDDRHLLLENCTLQCYLDDACVIKISDLQFFNYESEHPNIVGIDREELESFLKIQGVLDQLEDDLDALQTQCQEELQERQGGGNFF